MSQSSQGSTSSLSEIFSQETFNHMFNAVDGLFPNQQDFHRVQTEYFTAPLQIQLSEGNLQENYEMVLDCRGVSRPEGDLQYFSQDQSFRTCPEIKQEPCDNFFQSSTLTTPPPEQPLPQPFIVSNTDFPGQYGFDVGFEEEKAPPTKSAQWTYSLFLKKLFVKMRCIVPIRIKLHCFPPQGYFVRVVVIYRHPEHYREIVERCPNHITKQKDGHHAPKHLMRCENPTTEYETCPVTGRHTFKIPLSAPPAGTDFVQEMFQFMCFSSCPGGLNRRPILVIFTLECGSHVLGRKVLDVRICASPGRDRGIEETKELKKRNRTTVLQSAVEQPTQPVLTSTPSTTPPPTPQVLTAPPTPCEESTSAGAEEVSENCVPKLTKKRSYSYLTSGVEVRALSVEKNRLKKLKRQEDEEIFTIQVKGREKYEMLLKIKESLDLMDLVPEAMVDKYRTSCPPCGRWTSSMPPQTADSQNLNNSHPDEAEVSQLSRSDSGSSYQSPTSSQQSTGSTGGSRTDVSAVRFTLRRTVSLDRKYTHQ